MRRPHRGDKPLPCGIIRNAEQPDLPAAPGLGARPLNRIIEVTKLRRRIWIEPTRRLTGTTGVHIDNDIAIRDPHLGIRPLAFGRYTFACKIAPSRTGTSAFCSKSISYCPVMAYRRLSEPGQEASISLVTTDIVRWSNGACPHYADDNSKIRSGDRGGST